MQEATSGGDSSDGCGVSWDDPMVSDGETSGRPCEIYALYETPKNISWARGDSNPHGLSATRP